MGNTESTKSNVVAAAYKLACQIGLMQISVRTVAAEAGLSKTGAITHFKNLETLQLAVLDYAAQLFVQDVFTPAMECAKGLPRLRDVFRRWVQKNSDSTNACLCISASFEVDDRPGPIRDCIENRMLEMRQRIVVLIEEAIEEGHFIADVPKEEMAFSLFSLATGTHHDAHMLRCKRGATYALNIFEKLLTLHQASPTQQFEKNSFV